MDQMNKPKQLSPSQSGYKTRGSRKSKSNSMDTDDDEYDGSKHASVDEDNLWTGGRKSSRLAAKKRKKVDYNEETAIDRYLASQEAEVLERKKLLMIFMKKKLKEF